MLMNATKEAKKQFPGMIGILTELEDVYKKHNSPKFTFEHNDTIFGLPVNTNDLLGENDRKRLSAVLMLHACLDLEFNGDGTRYGYNNKSTKGWQGYYDEAFELLTDYVESGRIWDDLNK